MLNNLKLCIFSLIFSCLFSFNLEAHQLSRSFSKWEINDKNVEVSFTVPARQVTFLPAVEGPLSSLDGLLARHLEKHLKKVNYKYLMTQLNQIGHLDFMIFVVIMQLN